MTHEELPRFHVIRAGLKPSYISVVSGIAWSPDGLRIASYIDIGANIIRVWSREGAVLKQIQFSPRFYGGEGLVFVNDGRSLLTSPKSPTRDDIALSRYSSESGALEDEVPGLFPEGPIGLNAGSQLFVAPNGKTVAVITAPLKSQPVTLYRSPDWTKQQVLGTAIASFAERVFSVAFSHDSRSVAVGRGNGTVVVYDVATREARQTIVAFRKEERVWAKSVAFSLDDRSLYVGAGGPDSIIVAADGRAIQPGINETSVEIELRDPLRVFDIGSGQCRNSFSGLKQPIRIIRSSPTRDEIVFQDGANRVIRLTSGNQGSLKSLLRDGETTYAFEWSPDGNLLAIGVNADIRLYKTNN